MKLALSKLSPTTVLLVVATVVFLVTPYIPTPILNLLAGNRLGAGALLLGSMLAFRLDITIGLAVFLAVCALFLEQRRRIVLTVQKKILTAAKEAGAPVEELSRPAEDLVPGEVHPAREGSVTDEVGYEPEPEGSSNSVGRGLKFMESESATEDEKAPLETVPSNGSEQVAEFLQGRGLA